MSPVYTSPIVNNQLFALSSAVAAIAEKIDTMQAEIDLIKGENAGSGDAVVSASAKIVMEAKIAAADTVSDALAETEPRIKELEGRVDALEAAAAAAAAPAAAPGPQPAAAAAPNKPSSGRARKGAGGP